MYKWSEMSPRERDALVAEKVMGWKDVGFSDYETCIVETGDDEEVREFHPSTDISAVWEVVEHFDGYAISKYSINGRHRVILYNNDGTRGEALGQIGQPLAEIVCLAALRAVGVEIE